MSHADIIALNDTGEDDERGLALIRWNRVSSVVDARKRQVAVLANLPSYVRGIRNDIGVTSSRECGIVG